MLQNIKLALRINSSTFDDEIFDLIDAAKADLMLVGISEAKVNDYNDALIRRAITIYCKANFGLDNPDSEKLMKSYEMLKMSMSLAGDYNVV